MQDAKARLTHMRSTSIFLATPPVVPTFDRHQLRALQADRLFGQWLKCGVDCGEPPLCFLVSCVRHFLE